MWDLANTLTSPGMLGVDFGAGAVKVAEIYWEKQQPVLRLAKVIDLSENKTDIKQVETELQRLSSSMANSKKAVIAAGANDVLVRNTLYPVMSMNELRRVIAWDIATLIPYEPGTYYYDFTITGNEATRMKVLVVAVLRESVDTRIQIIKQAGLTPIAVDIEPLAVYRTLSSVGNILVVDIGSCSSWITLFENNVPVVYRHIFHNKKTSPNEPLNIPDLEENLLSLYEGILLPEMNRTIEYYQTLSPEAEITQILCLEKRSNTVNFAEFIGNKTGISAKLHDPFNAIRIAREIQSMKSLSSQLTIAIGLALYGGDL